MVRKKISESEVWMPQIFMILIYPDGGIAAGTTISRE
jgi:hypothetical protein